MASPAAEQDEAKSPDEGVDDGANDAVSSPPVAGLAIKNVASINESVVAGESSNVANDQENEVADNGSTLNPETSGENITEEQPMEEVPVASGEPEHIPMESGEAFEENLQEILDAAANEQPPSTAMATASETAADMDSVGGVGGDVVDDHSLAMLSELEGDIGLPPPGVLSDQYPPGDDLPF